MILYKENSGHTTKKLLELRESSAKVQGAE
jgi:hypothetical protein